MPGAVVLTLESAAPYHPIRSMPHWLSDWLQDHPTAVAVLAPAGAALCSVGLRYASNRWWIAGFIALIAVFAALPSAATRANRLHQGRRAAEDCLKRLLETCAHSFGYPAVHVRVNIMTFTEDRTRRRVDARTAFNMDTDPDADLEIDATAGVSGQVVVNRRAAFGDISLPLQPGGPDWGLRASEKARIRPSLLTILSVPVFNPADPAGPLLATLQIDSDETLDEIGFDLEDQREVAERFADVVSLLLEAGR